MQPSLPDHLLYPLKVFAESLKARCDEGLDRMRTSKVAIVGLARNCGPVLAANLNRLEQLVADAREWCLHVESNDCTDNTLDVLHDFSCKHKQATYHYQMLGRKQYGAEFSGPRTIALAEYRHNCQRWVAACAGDADYVIAIDFDQWGGWSHFGVFNGLGWLVELQGAYGMASVSLLEWQQGDQRHWVHYDCWAMRGVGQPTNYWDDYTAGLGGWKHHLLPPVGSPPMLVASAFGGLTIYRKDAYLKGTYDGTADCEHVPFHKSIARATGQHLYVCPAMRCVMQWVPEERHARQHGDD